MKKLQSEENEEDNYNQEEETYEDNDGDNYHLEEQEEELMKRTNFHLTGTPRES